jgi:hypothetical protein
VEKAWQDTELLSARFAFDNGFTTGLPSLSGKGKRIILVHIGNENGFLTGAGTCWVSGNKTDDYHDDMCFKVRTTASPCLTFHPLPLIGISRPSRLLLPQFMQQILYIDMPRVMVPNARAMF